MEAQGIYLTQYHHTHWRKKAELLHCQIWENSQSHKIAEAYVVYNYERTHAKINRNKKFIVNALGAIHQKANNSTHLLIERIPSRLSEIHSLSEAQAIKILYAVFKGLQQLQQVYGLMRLSESCICFNEYGHVKIWVNPDLSSLQPAYPFRDNSNNNKKIIQIIFQTIETLTKKCFNKIFIGGVLNKLLSNKIKDLHQVADLIIKIGEFHYIDVHHEKIPDKITPVRSIQRSQNKEALNKQVGIHRDKKWGHNRKLSCQNWIEQRQFNSSLALEKQANCNNRDALSYPPQIKKKKTGQERELGLNCEVIPLLQGFENISQRIDIPYEDSFSRNLKYEEKEIVVSGQFQTFGMLQDSLIESQEIIKKRESKQKKEISRKSSFAEINEQMQRLLTNEEQQKQNKSCFSQCLSIDRKKIKKIDSQIRNFCLNSNFMKKQQHKQSFQLAQKQSSTCSVNKLQMLRQKSSYQVYNNIDKKYEQYLKTRVDAHFNRNLEQRKETRMTGHKPRVPSFLQSGRLGIIDKLMNSDSNNNLDVTQLSKKDGPVRYYPLTER